MGRPPKLTQEQREHAIYLWRHTSCSLAAIGRHFGVSGMTISKLIDNWNRNPPTPQEGTMNHRDSTTPVSADEASIERDIQAKGLNAPRLTPQHIDATILAEQYHVFPGTTLTVCCLTLRNGFQVTGESAAASPENFDEQIGRDIARRNARDKVWSLEGYLLREQLHNAGN